MTYHIKIDDIPPEGLQLNLHASAEPWLRSALAAALQDQFLPDDDAHLMLVAAVMEKNVDLIGGLYIRSHDTCDRCLREFLNEQQIPLHMILSPAQHPGGGATKRADAKSDGAEDDVNFSVYHGRQIDLEEIIKEHVVLEQPMQTLCTPNCQGLCPKCAQNLNDGPCKCGKGEMKS